MKKFAVMTLVLGAVAILLGPAIPGTGSALQAAPGAGAPSLRGDFAFSLHGVNPLGQPCAAVGVFTADGRGNLRGTRIAVDNGMRSSADFTCAYTIGPDGLFSTGDTCIDVGEAVSNVTLDGALSANGKELFLAASGLPAGAGLAVVSGVAHKQ